MAADEASRVLTIALNSNEEDLSAYCASGQAYTFKLANYELYKAGDAMFRPLVTLFHGVSAGGASSEDVTADLHASEQSAASNAAELPLQSFRLADPATSPLSGITGLDVCARKPVFVTCGADHTVRLWSYRFVNPLSVPDAASILCQAAFPNVRAAVLLQAVVAFQMQLMGPFAVLQRAHSPTAYSSLKST
jgi:hypothetical protein